MKTCRHHLDPDACELCQDDIKAAAAKLGRAGGEARRLALSPERREEIARIAAQRRWSNVVWDGIRVDGTKASRQRRLTTRAAYVQANSKNNKIREILKADPDRRTSDVAKEVGTFQSVVSNIRRELGLPRQFKPTGPKITEAALATDEQKLVAMRRIVAYVRQGYKPGRIAQLLDMPEKVVRSYLAAKGDVRIGRLRRKTERPMTPEDVEAAYALWREGNTYRTIAQMLNFSNRQIETALRKKLIAEGDK